MPKRLFIAIELPEICQQELAASDPGIKGLRWLPAAQLHLTMSFLGDVDATHESKLRNELAAVKVPPFILPIRGVGTFGGSSVKVVWAGVGKGHPHLFALHQHLQDAVLRADLEPDLRPFHPHITLGRAKDVRHETMKPFLRKHADTEFDIWKVGGFVLCSSVLGRDGAAYSLEMRVDW
jgi:RNA 2',3'-cyclic 3'-phosphodiesterase